MRKTNQFLFLLGLFISSFNLHAQEKENNKKENNKKDFYKRGADQAFEQFSYRSAAELYLHADTNDVLIIQKLGDSYKLLKDYEKAEHWYAKEAHYPNQKDLFDLHYAEILSNNGKYEMASNYYKKFLIAHPGDTRATNQAQTFVNLSNFYRDSSQWRIRYLSLNTSKDEFSPVYFNKGLIFTSNRESRFLSNNIFGWTASAFTDLYTIDDTASIQYLKAGNYIADSLKMRVSQYHRQSLPVSVNDTKVLGDITLPRSIADAGLSKGPDHVKVLKGGLNTRYHDGPMSLTADQTEILYTRNSFEKSKDNNAAKGIFNLKMYSAKIDKGKWHDIRPFQYNNQEYSTGHPALSPDGLVLYFVSDMPGGYGAKDIYYSTRENRSSSWSKPINLGSKINTEGDEVFPYVAPNGDLYFSSEGHTGLGGLDIFYVKIKNNLPASEVINPGFPLNSSKDDFGIIMNKEKSSGYFSSNRYGSDDIFKFDYKPLNSEDIKDTNSIQTKGITKSKTLPTDQKDATNEKQDVTTDTQGIPNDQKGVPNDKQSITNAKQVVPNEKHAHPIDLKSIDCDKLRPIVSVANVYFDLNKYDIRPDAVQTLNKLAGILKEYKSVHVLVRSHTDSRASDDYNLQLSHNRSKAVIRYLVKHGISSSRLVSQYFGESKLTNECRNGVECSEYQQQKNRRTEFYLMLDGENITLKCKLNGAD